MTAVVMDPFDPFASDHEEEEEVEEEGNLFATVVKRSSLPDDRLKEELYSEVETRHLRPLGLGPDDDDDDDDDDGSDDFDDEDDDDEDEDDKDESVSNPEDVFGMSLADVDLWDDFDDDNNDDDDQNDPFAPAPTTTSNGRQEFIDFPGFPPLELEQKHDQQPQPQQQQSNTEKKRESSKRTTLRSQNKSQSTSSSLSSSNRKSMDEKRRSSKSSSKSTGTSHRSKAPNNDIDLLVPELSSTLIMKKPSSSRERDRGERRSSSKNGSRSRHDRPQSSSSPKEEFGDGDRIGELLKLIKKENSQDNTARREHSSRGEAERGVQRRHSSRDGVTGSLRDKLTAEMASPSDKRRTSSSASACSSGRKSSSTKKDHVRHSYDESFRSWNGTLEENDESTSRHPCRPPRRTSSRTNKADSSTGLDSFMKSTRTSSSRRGDAEHRSVVSAPATTSAEALSQRCQKMKMTF